MEPRLVAANYDGKNLSNDLLYFTQNCLNLRVARSGDVHNCDSPILLFPFEWLPLPRDADEENTRFDRQSSVNKSSGQNRTLQQEQKSVNIFSPLYGTA